MFSTDIDGRRMNNKLCSRMIIDIYCKHNLKHYCTLYRGIECRHCSNNNTIKCVDVK